MKIYEIVIHEGKMSYEQSHYVLAVDFEGAYDLAQKLLTNAQKKTEDAYIESISEQFELEVVK